MKSPRTHPSPPTKPEALGKILLRAASAVVDAAASDPVKTAEMGMLVGKMYVDHREHARMGWLRELSLSSPSESVRKAADELMKAIDATAPIRTNASTHCMLNVDTALGKCSMPLRCYCVCSGCRP